MVRLTDDIVNGLEKVFSLEPERIAGAIRGEMPKHISDMFNVEAIIENLTPYLSQKDLIHIRENSKDIKKYMVRFFEEELCYIQREISDAFGSFSGNVIYKNGHQIPIELAHADDFDERNSTYYSDLYQID